MAETAADERERGERRRVIAPIALFMTAVALAEAASRLNAHDAAVYRVFSDVPGLIDICGDYTWAARAVPPGVAAIGVLLTIVWPTRRRVDRPLRILGVVLVAVLAFAVSQNAIPFGEQHCIID